MGSDDALRTVFDLKIISIAVVIALIVGAGAGYMVGNSPVPSLSPDLSSLMEERDQLEAECDSLYLDIQGLAAELDSTQELLVDEQRDYDLLEERYMKMLVIDGENQALQRQVMYLESEIDSLQDYIEHFEGEYEELHDAFVEIERNYEVLQEAFETLNQSYSDLVESLNMTVVEGFSQTIEYNISAGTDRTWEFLIPEYGIIWEARIVFSGAYVRMYQSYRIGDKQYLTGNSGTSLITEDHEYLVYYGPQDYLWGTLELEYYLHEREEDELWIIVTLNSQTIGQDCSAHIDLSTGGHPE